MEFHFFDNSNTKETLSFCLARREGISRRGLASLGLPPEGKPEQRRQTEKINVSQGPHVKQAPLSGAATTAEISSLLERLFPLCRSLTGPGNRETLRMVSEIAPLTLHEYPSGTPVYGWTIPPEWTPRAARIKDAEGHTLVDFAVNNVHLMGYSEPVQGRFTLAQLQPRLHYRVDLPGAIPYRTSYYKRDWGFCLSYDDYRTHFAGLPDDTLFDVLVDADLAPGSLTVGECLIPGETEHEVLISTYLCHPSLANDNLSGVALTAFLARALKKRKNRYSYRVVFLPETIGAIAYACHNEAALKRMDCGFVVTCTAGPGPFGYKASFDPGHRINRIAEECYAELGVEPLRYPFDPHGSDERQYSSPGFRLNTVSLCKDKYYEYPEYHTSLDTLDFISAEDLSRNLGIHLRAIEKLEGEHFFRIIQPYCETMLSPHGLYPVQGGGILPGASPASFDHCLWLLCLCDGRTSVESIATRLNAPLDELLRITDLLTEKKLLQPLPCPDGR